VGKDAMKHILAESNTILISSDSWVLDSSKSWINLAGYLIENLIENPNTVYSKG